MRRLFTAVVIATLSAVLVGVPAFAAPASSPSAPLGVVLSADNAHVGAGVTTSGATIYDGDRLETPEGATSSGPANWYCGRARRPMCMHFRTAFRRT